MIGAGVLSAAIFLTGALLVPGVREPERWAREDLGLSFAEVCVASLRRR